MVNRLLFVLVAAVAALALTGCWTMARGGPGNTGEQLSESVLSPATVGALTLQWRASGTGVDGPAIADATHVFVVAGSTVGAFPYDGGSDCSGAVCVPEWAYGVGGVILSQPTPALAGGRLYAVDPDNGGSDPQSRVAVYPASPDATCTAEAGAPPFCPPVWTADLPGQLPSTSPPIVTNDHVYVATSLGFAVYDARGITNCSGTPKTCTPLWIGLGTTTRGVGLTVANGHVYLPVEGNRILVFDAEMPGDCPGAPGVCPPRFELRTDSVPPISGHFGVVAVKFGAAIAVDGGAVYAFDATGSSCTGSPKVCLPRWHANGVHGVPAVDADHVYLAGNDTLVAYDRLRGDTCTGKPVVCTPVWTCPGVSVFADTGGPSVANGVVYVPTLDNHLFGFPAAGCPTTGDVCAPLVDRQLPGSSRLPPVVAQGHVFVGSSATSETYAYGIDPPAPT